MGNFVLKIKLFLSLFLRYLMRTACGILEPLHPNPSSSSQWCFFVCRDKGGFRGCWCPGILRRGSSRAGAESSIQGIECSPLLIEWIFSSGTGKVSFVQRGVGRRRRMRMRMGLSHLLQSCRGELSLHGCYKSVQCHLFSSLRCCGEGSAGSGHTVRSLSGPMGRHQQRPPGRGGHRLGPEWHPRVTSPCSGTASSPRAGSAPVPSFASSPVNSHVCYAVEKRHFPTLLPPFMFFSLCF